MSIRTISRIVAVGLIALSVGFATACGGGSDSVPDEPATSDAPQEEKTVVLYQYRFNPSSLEIPSGTKVIFENRDPEVHNVNIPALNIDQNIQPNETWEYTFDTQGEFAVSNRMSEGMRLDLVVQ